MNESAAIPVLVDCVFQGGEAGTVLSKRVKQEHCSE